MTQVVTTADTVGPFNRAYLFRLIAPKTGANNVVISWTGTISLGPASGAQGFNGVDQTTPVSNSNSANGNSTTLAVSVTSAVGEWTIDDASSGSSLSLPTQTQDWLLNGGSNSNGGGSDGAGAASVAFQWTQPSDVWAHVALSLKASAAAVGRLYLVGI